MKEKFIHIYHNLLAPEKDLSLKHKLFFSSVFISTLFTAAASILISFMTFPFYLKLTGYAVLSVLIGIYYLGRKKKNIEPLIIVFVSIAFLSNVGVWLFGGGTNSQNVILIGITLILSLIIVPETSRFIVLFAYLILLGTGYFMEFYYPELFSGYQNEAERLIDGLSTSLYSMVFIYLIIQFLLKYYAEEKEKAEKSEKELQDLNHSLETIIDQRTLELKESRNLLETLLNSTAEGIYGIDNNGKFTFINSSSLKFLGYSDENQLLGKSAHELIHHSYPDGSPFDPCDCKFHCLLHEAEGLHDDNVYLIKADGSFFPAEVWSYQTIHDGKITGAVVSFLDITERKKVREELLRAKQEAESANSVKSDFLLNISHEFRTPLNSVIGYSELVRTSDENRRNAYADSIQASGRRLLDMVSNVLELVNIEKTNLVLENDYIEINSFFSEFGKNFESNIVEKGLRFRTNISKKMPSSILTDERHLRLVINNLVENAIKFTSQGEIILDVNLSKNENAVPEKKVNIEIRITDTGKGIPPELQEKIFEVFSRAEIAGFDNGIGIGLSLAHRVVSGMNGTLNVESETGRGSSFILTLNDVAFRNDRKNHIDVLTDPAGPSADSINVDLNEISDRAGLFEELQGNHMSTWKTFEARQPLGEVRKFSLALAELGSKHNSTLVREFGNRLTEAVDSLDINEMLKLLKSYTGIVSAFRI